MIYIVARTFWGHRVALLLMALGLASLMLLVPVTFTALPDGLAQQFLQHMPRGLQAFMKTSGDLAGAFSPDGYAAFGYRHPIYLIILSGFAISAAGGGLAREIERGTIFLLLARPLPRYSLVIGKAVEASVSLVLLASAAFLGTAIGAAIAHLEPFHLARFLLVSGYGLCLFLAIGGYSFLISALTSDGGKATGISAGLTVLFFLMDFLADLWHVTEWLGPLSVFHYYIPSDVAIRGVVPWGDMAVLLSVAGVTFAAALVVFQRRDIP